MSKDLTKKAVEMLLRGATLVSDPCPYCKGVRVIKDGSALCVNCGREGKDNDVLKEEKPKDETKESSALDKLDQKLKDLTDELQQENNHTKQQQILKSINDIIAIKERLKKI